LFVINRIIFQQLFVSDEKRRRGRDALIPDQRDPALRFENAGKLRTGFFPVEPVKRLSRRDEINARVVQRSLFRLRRHAVEARIAFQQSFGGLAHLPVRLDPVNQIAVPQKHLRQNASAGTYVSDDRTGCQFAFAPQRLEDSTRIARPVFDVVFDSTGKTLCYVRHFVPHSVSAALRRRVFDSRVRAPSPQRVSHAVSAPNAEIFPTPSSPRTGVDAPPQAQSLTPSSSLADQ